MEPTARPSKHAPELRERAVRMVFDHAPEHPSQWATIRSVAEKIGCTVEALRRWVRQAERNAGQRPGLTTDERQRLKQLEREKFELKRANENLEESVCIFRAGGARPPSLRTDLAKCRNRIAEPFPIALGIRAEHVIIEALAANRADGAFERAVVVGIGREGVDRSVGVTCERATRLPKPDRLRDRRHRERFRS